MRVTCSGSLHVALPPARARELFTPEGERRWAPRWDPDYPAGSDGPVFTTAHPGDTIWIALGDLRYARVTPGVHAGTVAVRCEPADGGTRAHVTYDLTALSPAADLARFQAGFADLMREWERAIAAAL
jgi:hypothetical protein